MPLEHFLPDSLEPTGYDNSTRISGTGGGSEQVYHFRMCFHLLSNCFAKLMVQTSAGSGFVQLGSLPERLRGLPFLAEQFLQRGRTIFTFGTLLTPTRDQSPEHLACVDVRQGPVRIDNHHRFRMALPY